MPKLYDQNIILECELMKVVGHELDILARELQSSLPARWTEVRKVWLYVEVHEESSKEISLRKEEKSVRERHTNDGISEGPRIF